MNLTDNELRQSWRVLHECQGNKSEAARRLGVHRSTLEHRLRKALEKFGDEVTSSHVKGSKTSMPARLLPLPTQGSVNRYILTSAQNNTHVHAEVWKNLQALAAHLGAQILVSRFTYNKSSYGEKSVKPGTAEFYDDVWYAPEIIPFVSDERIEIAPSLVWCGELQIEPTAVRPLSGFEAYQGRKSCIIPHAKIALQSVASGKHEGVKLLFSTGTVTQRNYIQKRAGLRAELHHNYGALLAEVDSNGRWFVRQLEAGEMGEIHDLDIVASKGVIKTSRVEAITWGDIHAQRVDQNVRQIGWLPGGMLDTLRPRYQFLHDVLDFSSRSHHDLKDPFKLLKISVRGQESVWAELRNTAELLGEFERPWCHTVVVNGNHDRHLDRWLRDTDWRDDLENAEILLTLQLEKVRAVTSGADVNITEFALRQLHCPDFQFLDVDESFITCKEFDGGIENGMHGDLGPNGARGSSLGFSRMGRRANIGHSHSASIVDGVYTAGTSSKLDMEYNGGPSSWSHSHVVTYPNGRRAIVTMWDGRYRAA